MINYNDEFEKCSCCKKNIDNLNVNNNLTDRDILNLIKVLNDINNRDSKDINNKVTDKDILNITESLNNIKNRSNKLGGK